MYKNVSVFKDEEDVYEYQCNKTIKNEDDKYNVIKLTPESLKRERLESIWERNRIWPNDPAAQEELEKGGVREYYWLNERVIKGACKYFNVHCVQISIDSSRINGMPSLPRAELSMNGEEEGTTTISPIFMSTGGGHFSKRLPTEAFLTKYSVSIIE